MNRRKLLATLSSAAYMSTAGCLSSVEEMSGPDTEDVKDEAETIPWGELYRNISEYEDEPVTYSDVSVIDIIKSEDGYYEFVLGLSTKDFSNDHLLYGLWEGNPFQRDDKVELWGVVNGTTTYQSISGEKTVPEVEIVDMELL